MGVWIETLKKVAISLKTKSHPAWVCGLKLAMVALCLYLKKVTPCVGVWIETCHRIPPALERGVTPCVGVWIETVVI